MKHYPKETHYPMYDRNGKLVGYIVRNSIKEFKNE